MINIMPLFTKFLFNSLVANHKSALKAYKVSLVKKARNTAVKSRMKTFINKVKSCASSGDSQGAVLLLRKAESEIMKAASKGVVKCGAASRKVSRLAKYVKNFALATTKQVSA